MEKEPFIPMAEKISSGRPLEVSSLPKDEEPLPADLALNPASGGTGSGQATTQRASTVGAALSDRPSHPEGEKRSRETKPSFNEKRAESFTKHVPEKEKAKPPKNIAAEKSLLPRPPAAQSEGAPPKSIGVEQVGGNDRTLASDVLNHFNSGVAFYDQKEFSKAIQAYQKVIELEPAYVEAYNNLGIIYQEIGNFDKALEVYHKAIDINRRYEKTFNNLGILYFLNERYEESIEAFQKALAINPYNIESHINLGILFKKQGQVDQAIGSYQKALSLNPLHGETHYNMGLLYEHLEKWDLAIHHYQTFIELSLRTHPDLVGKVQRHLSYLKTKGIKK
jgi:tetratricopeptide (TPR) repeat protein